jgi:hypothetical protein
MNLCAVSIATIKNSHKNRHFINEDKKNKNNNAEKLYAMNSDKSETQSPKSQSEWIWKKLSLQYRSLKNMH